MALSNQSPRVEIIASTLSTGGAERVVEALAKGLPAHGYGVRLLCLHGPGEIGEGIAESGTSVLHTIARFRFDPLVLPRLASLLRRKGDAILLSVDHHDAVFWGAFAARLAGLRHCVMMVHATGLWARGSSLRWSDRAALPAYERIVALARTHSGYLVERERIDGEKIRIINNGIDTERFHPTRSPAERARLRGALGIPPGAFVVTIVAALRPEKNHGMFLEAASRIGKRRTDFVFLIVGEGKEAEKLQRTARGLSLGGAVRFMGRRSDVAEIAAASDASVLCSYPVVETFPLVVLEAMASGVPVVATDVGAVREMLLDGEEGIIIPPGDADSLERALLMLAESPDKRKGMGIRARDRVVREFTVETMVRNYACLFDEILGR